MLEAAEEDEKVVYCTSSWGIVFPKRAAQAWTVASLHATPLRVNGLGPSARGWIVCSMVGEVLDCSGGGSVSGGGCGDCGVWFEVD